MQLRFYARADRLVNVPYARPLPGESPRYVGRGRIPGEPNKGGAAFPALREAFECDSESDVGRRLLKRMRDELRQAGSAPLWPADADTARECGIEFVPVTYDDAAKSWIPAATAPAKPAAKAEKKAE